MQNVLSLHKRQYATHKTMVTHDVLMQSQYLALCLALKNHLPHRQPSASSPLHVPSLLPPLCHSLHPPLSPLSIPSCPAQRLHRPHRVCSSSLATSSASQF